MEVKYMNPNDYRSIKVPAWVYQNIQQAELSLQRKGLENLPQEVIAPTQCPVCRMGLEVFEAKYEYRHCPQCGYMQQDFTAASNFFLGVVVGLGLALLLNALTEGEERREAPKAIRASHRSTSR